MLDSPPYLSLCRCRNDDICQRTRSWVVGGRLKGTCTEKLERRLHMLGKPPTKHTWSTLRSLVLSHGLLRTVSLMITVGRQGFCSAFGSFPRIRLGPVSVSMRSVVFSLSSSPPPEKANLSEEDSRGDKNTAVVLKPTMGYHRTTSMAPFFLQRSMCSRSKKNTTSGIPQRLPWLADVGCAGRAQCSFPLMLFSACRVDGGPRTVLTQERSTAPWYVLLG